MIKLLKKSCVQIHSGHSRHTAHGIKYEPAVIDRYHKYTHSQKRQYTFSKVDLLYTLILQFWDALQMEM